MITATGRRRSAPGIAPALVVVALAAFALSACGVTGGAGRDLTSAGNAVSNASTATQQKIHQATGAAIQ